MSEIKVNSIKGVAASSAAISINNTDGTCTANITNNLSNRSKVINGDFAIDQRNNGAEVNPAVSNTYYPDRWSAHKDQTNKFKIQRVSDDAPEGFKHALKCTVTNAHNPTGGNYFYLAQRIEGNNIIDLDMGKSTAKKITVSFFVKSSVTGIYSVAIRNNGYDCSAVGEYTINSANTWEKKTINFLAATNIGTWLTTNGVGLRLEFVLGVGSSYQTSTLLSFQPVNKQASSNAVQWINNAGATFLLTGVQLEVGDFASDCCHEPYSETLRKCQRYYQVVAEGQNSIIGICYTISSVFYSIIDLQVTMRATPTMEVSNWTDAFRAYGSSGGVNVSTLTILSETRNNRVFVYQSGNPGVGGLRVYGANSGEYGKLAFTSEL